MASAEFDEPVPPVDRWPAIDRVIQAALDYGAAADTVTDAAARVLGLNRTDMRLMAIIRAHQRLTAGRLAAAASLSPAATTTAIRRLVRAGYADRKDDPEDARRSVLSLTRQGYLGLERVYGAMLSTARAYLSEFDPADLAVVESFLRRGQNLQLDRARELLDQLDP